MKNAVRILVIMLLQYSSYGQAIVGNSYVTIADAITVYGIKGDGSIDSLHNYKVGIGAKFSVNGFDKNNNIKLIFWKYPSKPALRNDSSRTTTKEIIDTFYTLKKRDARAYNDTLENISAWANFKEFVLPLSIFNSACKLYYGRKYEFNWGVMSLPIKVRFGNQGDKYFDFDEKLNLGFVFGLRNQIPSKIEQSVNYLLGVGITSVKTDSLSLRSGKNPSNPTGTALSVNGGILYQYESFQVGLFLGMDFIPGTVGRDWKNQGKPWLGIAVGVSLFSRNTTQGGTGTNK